MIIENPDILWTILTIIIAIIIVVLIKRFKQTKKNRLHKAVERDDDIAVANLLSQDFDINAYGKNGFTPLEIAINYDALKSLNILLSRGVNVNKLDVDGESILHSASAFSDIDIVKSLVNKGAKVNLKSKDGYTPLHFACEDDANLATVKYLLQRNADINAKTKSNETPLHLAVRAGSKEIITYLLAENCNLSIKDYDGFTAKERAKDIGNEEIELPFLTPEELAKMPKYIELIDKTNISSLSKIIFGVIFIVVAGFVYNIKEFFSLFMTIIFGGVGILFFVSGVLSKVSLGDFGEISIYIDRYTTKVGDTLKGYVLLAKKLEQRQLIFKLSNKKYKGSDVKIFWENSAMGEIRSINAQKVIYFEIPIQNNLKKTNNDYSWELSFKQKSSAFFGLKRKEYAIKIR